MRLVLPVPRAAVASSFLMFKSPPSTGSKSIGRADLRWPRRGRGSGTDRGLGERAAPIAHLHADLVVHTLTRVVDDRVAGLEAVQHLHRRAAALADLDGELAHHVVGAEAEHRPPFPAPEHSAR